MPPTKTKKRALDAQEAADAGPQPTPAKQARQTEPYNFFTPKDVTPDELAKIADALGAQTDITDEMLESIKISVDASQKKITLAGFDKVFRFAGNVQLYGPDGEGMYPNLKDLKGIVPITEQGYNKFVDWIAAQFAKFKDAIAKFFSPGPAKNDFLNDPKVWVQNAIKDGTINLPVKRTERYNDDGSIDRVSTTLTAKAKVTRKGSGRNAEDDEAFVERCFGKPVAEYVRAEQAAGKRVHLPSTTDALGAHIDPEKLFTTGRAKLVGVLDVALVSLFVIEAKSRSGVPNFSSVTMLNGITGIRIIESGASAAPVMTDENRIKLAALL